MIEAIIHYQDSTLIMDLPRNIYDIHEKLMSIGCPTAPGRIPLTDNEDDALRVKLYGRIEMGNHLIRILSEQNTLADANALASVVLNASDDIKLKLGEKIVKDQYDSIPEIVTDIRQMTYVRSLKEIGVGIYFEEQNIDTLKSDSELYLVIYAGFAQSESESISKNITWTHRKNFEDGKPIFMYSRMLGYRKGEDGNPEIVPEEAAIVQRVFDMYLSGKSTDEISEILQAEKIVIPGKKLTFSKSMIIRMLKNEKYCGDAILQKTVTIDPISKKRKANEGEAPMWLVENSHPAIVTREIFNKAQEESARRKAKAPVSQKSAMTASGKYSKYALTEVMICGECGSRYKRVTWNIRGKRRIVWRCISRLDYGKKYCTESITVDEQALQRAIVRALNRFNVEDEATYLLLMKSTIGEAVGINGSSDEIDLLERRIDALNKRMLDLVSLSVQEGDDAENHEDDFKNISTQIEQLTKRITAIRESESENGDFQARLKEIQDIIDKRRENKDIYDDSIVRQMVECIKVYHDGRLQIILGGGYELEEYLEK